MLNIRFYITNQPGAGFSVRSPVVPRVGEYVCVEYGTLQVLRVEYTFSYNTETWVEVWLDASPKE